MTEEVERILSQAINDLQDVLFDLYALDNPEEDNREETRKIKKVKKAIEKLLNDYTEN